MGLDMYLNRMPRYRGATANDVCAVESYLDWMKEKEKDDSPYASDTFKEWCGIDEVPHERYIKFYSKFYNTKYASYDTEHKYGWDRIMEQVGYWRKCNAIHNWFVENVQDGIDDCDYHHEVTEDKLEDLLKTCYAVLDSIELVDGKLNCGRQYKDGEWETVWRDGKVIEDYSVSEELLPTTCGFFFGGTDYNEWYVDAIKDTIEIVEKVLETTDFDKEMIYYRSSW